MGVLKYNIIVICHPYRFGMYCNGSISLITAIENVYLIGFFHFKILRHTRLSNTNIGSIYTYTRIMCLGPTYGIYVYTIFKKMQYAYTESLLQ